jgi:hypothetical protein
MQPASARFRGSVLIDGWLRASWHLEGRAKDGKTTLFIRPTGRLPKRAAASVAAEARRLLRMIGPPGDDVRLLEPID